MLVFFSLLICISVYMLLVGLKLSGNLPYWSWAEVFFLPIVALAAMCGFLLVVFILLSS